MCIKYMYLIVSKMHKSKVGRTTEKNWQIYNLSGSLNTQWTRFHHSSGLRIQLQHLGSLQSCRFNTLDGHSGLKLPAQVTAEAQIQSLAQELTYATGTAIKLTKEKLNELNRPEVCKNWIARWMVLDKYRTPKSKNDSVFLKHLKNT